MKIKNIVLAGTLSLSCLMATGTVDLANGPGMTVTFVGTDKTVAIYAKRARLPNGAEFPTAGSFGYAKNPFSGGATMGATPDGRGLPEWVDFEWQEIPYLSRFV